MDELPRVVEELALEPEADGLRSIQGTTICLPEEELSELDDRSVLELEVELEVPLVLPVVPDVAPPEESEVRLRMAKSTLPE